VSGLSRSAHTSTARSLLCTIFITTGLRLIDIMTSEKVLYEPWENAWRGVWDSCHFRNLATQIFWFTATVACLLAFAFAFAFELRQRGRAEGSANLLRLKLARGQHKDNWLNCMVVWSVLLASGAALSKDLLVPGSLLLGWTACRTLRRLRALQRQ